MKDQPEEDAPFDVEAFDRWAATVPVDTETLSPEQEAEFAEIAAEYEAGRARLIPQDEVPAVLEAIGRARAA